MEWSLAGDESAVKKQFVKDLREGDAVNDCFLAVRKDLRTQQNGSKFLGMVFRDRTGEIGGILWNNAASAVRLFEVGDVVQVWGSVTSYQNRLQVRVDRVLPLRDGEFDARDLLSVPENTQEMMGKLSLAMGSIKNPWFVQLVSAFLDDRDFVAQFMGAAAGKKWHHAYPGGLVQHCHEMVQIAQAVCEVFPNLDRDLILAAIFLHDVGKLYELDHELLIEYTTPGRLLGHVAIGSEMVQRRISEIAGFPETLRVQLLHCILSHHGEYANGSPVLPKTPEAIALYHIDNLDAQLNAVERVIEETKGRGDSWSDYLPQIDRQIWTKEV